MNVKLKTTKPFQKKLPDSLQVRDDIGNKDIVHVVNKNFKSHKAHDSAQVIIHEPVKELVEEEEMGNIGDEADEDRDDFECKMTPVKGPSLDTLRNQFN